MSAHSEDDHATGADATAEGDPIQLENGEVYARLRAAQASMTPSDSRVAETIVRNPETVVRSSVSRLAELANVGPATVVRACQAAGFRGYQDLKLALARDLALQTDNLRFSRTLTASTRPGQIVATVLESSATALRDAISTVDETSFGRLADAIASCDRLIVIGNGTSAWPSQDCAYRFALLGLTVLSPRDVIGQNVQARLARTGDVCLVISHTGSTKATLRAAEEAKKAGATIGAVTSFRPSPLSHIAEHVIVAGGPEEGFRLEAMTSRIAHIAVLDALFVAVALRRPDAASSLDSMADVTAEHSI